MRRLFRGLFPSNARVTTATPSEESAHADATKAYQANDFAAAVPLYDLVIERNPAAAEAYYKRANALKNLGRFSEAIASYDAAVAHRPDLAQAWCNRGVVQQTLGLFDAALHSYDRAIALDAADALAHSNRGSLLQSRSRWDAALGSYDQAVALRPDFFQAWFQRGNVLKELGQIHAALVSYERAIAVHPEYPEAHFNRAVLLERGGRPDAALASYERAIELFPRFHQAHYNRAGVLKGLKRPEAALSAYERAIDAKDDYAEAHANYGVVLQEAGRREAALASYARAIAIRPDYAEAHFNRGTALKALMQFEAALASFDRAIELKPEYAEAHCDRAGVLRETGRWEEALAGYDRALALLPEFAEARFNRALVLLLLGDFERGWLQYEWRWKNAARLSLDDERKFAEPLWLGEESIAGKQLLLYSEQGLGDALQFCRFAKTVADRGASVVLEVQASLVPLVTTVEGVSLVVAEGDRVPRCDYRCPLLSLPLALTITLDTIPSAPRYLGSDAAKVRHWRARLATSRRPHIGLAWSGNPQNTVDERRSIPLDLWIGQLPREFEYVCLQREIRSADAEILSANPWILRVDHELRDFTETAALCECMDVVISVDTSLAHLSGGMGRPTWVLLPFNPDWRWLLNRDDSPWYSSVKLYRQRAIGEWSEVLARVGGDLRATLPSAADR